MLVYGCKLVLLGVKRLAKFLQNCGNAVHKINESLRNNQPNCTDLDIFIDL